MRPTKNQIQKWVIALRSGEYSQTTGTLEDDSGHCCLGVACEVFIPKKLQIRDNDGYLIGGMPSGLPASQAASPEWLSQIERILETYIPGLNDDGVVIIDTEHREQHEPFTFDEIADLLEYEYIYEVLS